MEDEIEIEEEIEENPAFFGIYVLGPDDPKITVPDNLYDAEPERVHRNWQKLKRSFREIYDRLKREKFTGSLIVKTTHGYGKRNRIDFDAGKPTLVSADWDSLVPDDRSLKVAPDLKAQAKATAGLAKGDTVQLYTRSGGWGRIMVLPSDGSKGGTRRTATVLYVGDKAGRVKVELDNGKQYTLPADRMVKISGGRTAPKPSSPKRASKPRKRPTRHTSWAEMEQKRERAAERAEKKAKKSKAKKRVSKRRSSANVSSYWFFELADGTYGDVESPGGMTRDAADAEVRDAYNLGPRAKVSLRKKRPKWAD